MKKEELQSLGLNEDQIKGVYKLNGLAVENVRGQMATVEEELKQVKADKADLESKLANQASSEDLENLKQAKADLESQLVAKDTEIVTLKSSTQEEINKIKYDSLLRSALKDAGAKNIKAALAVINLDSITLNDDGKLEGIAEELERVTADETTNFIFGAEESRSAFAQKRKGAPAPGVTKSSIMAIKDSSERQKAIKENIELFK